jgi:hypothetical protein
MSNTIPVSLTPAECPLLIKYAPSRQSAEELVQEYNRCVGRLQEVQRGEYASLLRREDFVQDVIQLLEDARQRLTRPKYVVGCIGITQAGKSTVVNNVLGAEVCKPGAMDATSSLPSRIVKAEKEALDLEYLTPTLFYKRLEKLCQEALGLGAIGDLEKDVLPFLDKPDHFRKDGIERPRLRDDLKYLSELIKAYKNRGQQVLTDPPRRECDLPYEHRYDYTTHGGKRGQDAMLLREARFRIVNSHIPDDLELCDLPGLDSKRTIDDIVTWEYLPHLDGAFLFVNAASNFLTEGMLKVLTQVMRVFDYKLNDRAWVIFNKMDTLTTDAFREGNNENIFNTIHRFLERSKLPPSQVCFTSKRIWDNALQNNGKAEITLTCTLLGQRPESPIPSCCPEELRKAWQELVKDGGISYLRQLIFERVARSVADEVRQDVERKLKRFQERLDYHLQAEQMRRHLDPEALRNLQLCFSEVSRLSRDLLLRWREYTAARAELDKYRDQELKNVIESLEQVNLEYSDQDELVRLINTNAQVIEKLLQQCLRNGTVFRQAYEEIRAKLETLPQVRWGSSQETCASWWRSISDQDQAKYEEWLCQGPIVSFVTSEMEAWLQGRSESPGGSITSFSFPKDSRCLELLKERLEIVFDQLDQRIRNRLRYRLKQLSDELSLLVDKENEPKDTTARTAAKV